MHFTTVSTSALCLLSTFISSAQAAPADQSITLRDVPMIDKGRFACVGKSDILFADFKAFIDLGTGVKTSAGDLCGHVINDRLKAKCGLGVTKFHCEAKEGGVAVAARLPSTCNTGSVTKALWESTSPNLKDLTCSEHLDPKIGPIVQKIIDELEHILIEAAKDAPKA